MGDYGFGLLQTANIPNNSSTIFGGGAFARAHTTPTLACSTQFSSLSPSSFSISSSNAGVSSLFLSAAARQQNMQDELLLGVTTTQQHRSLPSERNNIHNKTGQPTNNDPDFSKQLDQQNRLDFNHLNQQQLSEFKPTANSEKFGQQINNHQQLNHQQQQADFGKKQQPPPPPPPQGEFNHLAQNQYQTLNQQQGSPELDQGNCEKSSESPIKSRSPVAEEIVVSEANAVAAASSSPSPVNPNKAKIQMESPNNHLINSNGSSAANNILPTGLVAGFNNLQNQEMQNQLQTQGGSSSPSLPGFGTPWSVQTSSPPPPVTNSTNPNHASPMNQITNAETDNSFYPGIPSSINPAFFQSFSPVSANSCAGINVPGFNSPFSPQINLPQQQQNRRSPVSPQLHHQHQAAFLQQRNNYNHHQPIMKQSPWSSHQGSGWNSGGMSWGGMHGRDHRRPGGMGIPGTMNQISPMKKPFSSNVIAPPKFPRSAASLTPKSWIEDNVFRTDSNSNTLLPLQLQNIKGVLNEKLGNLNLAAQNLNEDLHAVSHRTGNAEQRISAVEDRVELVSIDTSRFSKDISLLRSKLDDIENRNRRNNLRLVGLSEGLETGNIISFLDKIFRYIMDLNESDPRPEIECAHRALRPKPSLGELPRPIILRMLRWSDKKGNLTWNGRRFFVFQDFSIDLQKKRALYTELRKKRQTVGLQYGILYGGNGWLIKPDANMHGRSSLFPIDDGLLDDGHSSQVVPGVLNSPNCYPHQNGERIERFSRKVFVGGLPPDIDEDEITTSFRRFGHLVVDWPHKAESKSYFPPKGYAFLLFQEESSVQALIEACIEEDGKLYLCVSSPTIKDKPVQIRPWNLSDSDFVMDGSQPLDPRKTIFVGGVPRPLRAVELAMIMDRLYGGVCYAGIDTDPELKYPKGAGRVAFSNQQSYIAAISARFVQLQHGDIDKRVEVKPYVLDDQMCDECQGARCGGKFAPFFCANVTCLQYYSFTSR
ncbi:Cytoplasmic polyadenylation element-binding protein 2 [Acipenser ruthenus]|uniref:Cytoplasmic polyadenylation element-binding protein 2 n=1 Tax=Acipenser ruthenus TaxID=7906 RepID=A0A444UD56_ACIRT|nr:Cytoplasmic polyadenylation element-binding protein 2 [Acipenser ruthenus]